MKWRVREHIETNEEVKKKMKRCFLIFILLFLLFIFSLSNAIAEAPTIRVGILPIVESLPFLIAQEKGFFSSRGLKVEIVPFASALERDSAIQSGMIHSAILDILGVSLLKSKGVPIVIVTNMTIPTPKRDLYTLVVSPGSKIQAVKNLRGRTIALSSHTTPEYVLEGVQSREGLKTAEIEKVEIKKIPLRYQMLLEGKVDAAVLPEPLGSLAVREGAKRVAGDFGLKGTQTILTFAEPIIEQHHEAFILFGKAYRRAIQAYQEDPRWGWDLLVKKGGLPAAVKDIPALNSFADIRVPGPEDIESVRTWMKGKGMDAPAPGVSLVNDGWMGERTK